MRSSGAAAADASVWAIAGRGAVAPRLLLARIERSQLMRNGACANALDCKVDVAATGRWAREVAGSADLGSPVACTDCVQPAERVDIRARPGRRSRRPARYSTTERRRPRKVPPLGGWCDYREYPSPLAEKTSRTTCPDRGAQRAPEPWSHLHTPRPDRRRPWLDLDHVRRDDARVRHQLMAGYRSPPLSLSRAPVHVPRPQEPEVRGCGRAQQAKQVPRE